MKTYNKLVRDNIPQIIANSGKKCATRVLNDAEYLSALDAKLGEEVGEYLQSGAVEELADIAEVIRAILRAKKCSLKRFDGIRKQKARQNGAFAQKIMLLSVD